MWVLRHVTFRRAERRRRVCGCFEDYVCVFLVVRVVVGLPIATSGEIARFMLSLLTHFEMFGSMSKYGITRLVYVYVIYVNAGTRGSLGFGMEAVIVCPILTNLALIKLYFMFRNVDFKFD